MIIFELRSIKPSFLKNYFIPKMYVSSNDKKMWYIPLHAEDVFNKSVFKNVFNKNKPKLCLI